MMMMMLDPPSPSTHPTRLRTHELHASTWGLGASNKLARDTSNRHESALCKLSNATSITV